LGNSILEGRKTRLRKIDTLFDEMSTWSNLLVWKFLREYTIFAVLEESVFK